jgi:polyhydroxybutyrate depolymerase
MKKHLALLLLLLITVTATFAQTTVIDSFRHSGNWRSYRLYIPASYTPGTAAPFILNMHGLGSNATEQQGYSNFAPIADTAGFLMAYPQGLTAQGLTYWNVGIPLTPNTDDVGFLSALIDTVARRYRIDLHRVYATGMSMGGYMSHYLALRLNNRITAIASVTGTMYSGVYARATPGRPVPMMQIHGTADSTVPYDGNAIGIPIDTLVRFWVRNNRCSSIPIITNLPNTNPADADASTVAHYLYTSGTNGATCEFYKIEGGGHTWPGSPYLIGVTNQDFNASAEIWRFFREYRLNQFVNITPPLRSLGTGFHPNPCTANIYLNNSIKSTVTITDLAGRTVISATTSTIATGLLAPGLYFVHYKRDGKAISEQLIKQ